MRSIDEVTELTHDSFIETYGRVNGEYHHRKASSEEETVANLPKINVTDHKEIQPQITKNDEAMNNSDESGSRKGSAGLISFGSSYDSSSDNALSSKIRGKRQKLRKISVDKLTSLGGAIQAAVTSKRSKAHSFSDRNGLAKFKFDRANWLSGVPSHSSRKMSDDSVSVSTEENDNYSIKSEGKVADLVGVPNPLSIPGSRIGACAHRGYLDCRNRKKQWERYWCVLQDACLYCYHTPQSDVTRHVILLRGYDVIADVTNLRRSKYLFRLQQEGFPTLHFSSDNHRDYLLWVGTLEKETRCVFSRNFSTGSDHSVSPKASNNGKSNSVSTSSTNITAGKSQVDGDLLKLQKDRLFNELALQKEQVLEEQKFLDKLESSASDKSDETVPAKKLTKEQILNGYERERLRQELKSKEFLTLLNRRRNSFHLKMTQYAKSLAPGVGQRNKENHVRYSAMERKLKEMQEALALIDRELEEEEALKQHNIERLERKRDLQLLIADQHDTMDILRRHEAEKGQLRFFAPNATPSSTRSRDTLGSIDELSDDLVTSSIASTSSDGISFGAGGDSSFSKSSNFSDSSPRSRRLLRSVSNPCCDLRTEEADGHDRNRSSDEDSGFQVSVGTRADDSYEFYHSVIRSFFPSPEKKMSLNGGESDVGGADLDDFVDLPSKDSTLKAAAACAALDQVDSAILAKIEDFELFAKLKLEETKKA